MCPFVSSTLLSFREEFFGKAGEVVGVRLATNEEGGFKGFGHVEFATVEDAQKVITFYLSIIILYFIMISFISIYFFELGNLWK